MSLRVFFDDFVKTVRKIDRKPIGELIEALGTLQRNKGRLFILGVGGSAANASHAVNDFRKICEIEAYAPTDNVSELTARTNDDGWESVFENWLKGSHLKKKDMVLVFSVGGGNKEKNISVNLVKALDYAKKIGCKTAGIVGRDGGYTKKVSDICVLIPSVNKNLITPFVESLQVMIWHCMVFMPHLQHNQGKWESLK